MVSGFLIFFIVFGFTASAPQVRNSEFRSLYANSKISPDNIPRLRILGGHEAEPHSIPYQVFITAYSRHDSWYCGGSLISKTTVLTAANCVDGAIKTEVVLGAHKPLEFEDTQVIITSNSTIIHEHYNRDDLTNDIALIKLPEEVELNDYIKTVPLPLDDSNDFTDETATVSGWGKTHGLAFNISDVLNTLDVKVISNQLCYAHFLITDTNICTTGDSKSGSCDGDNGGPLTTGGIQIGVISFTDKFCMPGSVVVYTRVSKYLDWIAAHS